MTDTNAMSEFERRQFLKYAGAGAAAVLVSGQLELARAIAGPQASSRLGNKALKDLARAVSGRVLVRGNSGAYNQARKVYNERFDGVRPAAVVQVRSAADVQATMKWANKYDVNVRARSGGHSYAGYSTTASGVVVDLSALNRVKVNSGSKQATVGAGVGLIDMYADLAKKGVTVPGGSCPTVGISGLAMGGGMGFASRKFGLTCDNIAAVSIVTADGKLRTASAKENSDLLWACQGGGGGNFGIVTDFTLETHRAKSAAYWFLSWPWSQASPALEAWQKLVASAPSDLCPFFSLTTGNGSPEVGSIGQFFGSESELRTLLKPLSDVDGAKLTTGTKKYIDLMQQWAGCSKESVSSCAKPKPVPFYGASDYVQKEADSAGREAMVKAIEERQGKGEGALLFDGYGGAINSVGATKTAFVHRDQLYCIQHYAEGKSKSGTKWIQSARKRLGKYVSGQAYQNYIDPTLKGWQQAYYGKNYKRLVQIKTKYDPDDRLNFKQGIKPKR